MAEGVTTLDSFLEQTEIELIWNLEGLVAEDGKKMECSHIILRNPDDNHETGEVSGFHSFFNLRQFYRAFIIPFKKPTKAVFKGRGNTGRKCQVQEYRGYSTIRIGQNVYHLVPSPGYNVILHLVENPLTFVHMWEDIESDLTGTGTWRYDKMNVEDLVIFGKPENPIAYASRDEAIAEMQKKEPFSQLSSTFFWS